MGASGYDSGAMSPQWTRLTLSCALLLAGCARSPPVLACPRDDYAALCAGSLAEGKLQQAELHCAMALEFSPERADDAWANWGLVALRREDTAKAKQRLLRALRYNPDHLEAQRNLAMAYLEEGAYAQALESFKRALRVSPDDIHARYHLGLTLLKLGKAAEARKEFDGVLSQATQLTPEVCDAWRDQGTVLLELRRFSEAEAAFGNCVRLQETDIGCRDGLEKARSAAAP
ncbi:tetratricopeptide repeat protein [Corallococcus llansteffanensis]|uniref:Tetratricopeptide repeat protein n=2 Tax=Corallococcus llansteffanensis TaxID=2316731 RepID=A0A3A8PRV2_9BACT|nr:tetratricopeptide repeat protein [Corallococcus llansteffanensis]